VVPNGFTYRGKHSSSFGVNLLSHKIHSPNVREYEDEAAGMDGVHDYGTEWGKREIEIRIDVTPNDNLLKTRQSQILNWLKPTLPAGILIFDDMPDRIYYAKYTVKWGIEQFNRYGVFELTMKCTDPFAYGSEQITETMIITSPHDIVIISAGTESTPPVIELTNNGISAVNGFTIQNEYLVEE
jgi:predicted phage tail component-like protein